MIYRFPLRDVKDMLLNQIGTNFFFNSLGNG